MMRQIAGGGEHGDSSAGCDARPQMASREAVHEGKEDPEPADADGHHADLTPVADPQTG